MESFATGMFLTPPLCANNEKEICHDAARLACGSCYLVQYCSKECQQTHWPQHKTLCRSNLMSAKYVPAWIREARSPQFIVDTASDALLQPHGGNRFLWGNMPALDIMKMADHEGLQDLKRDINLLFAASGDCRNVIKTIASLPEGYTGRCTTVLNDRDFAVVARNIILLLSALHFDPVAGASIMIHLWYSAFIPQIMLQTLQKEILPYIEDVCTKINDKPDDSIQAKTFQFAKGSLRVVLSKEDWTQLGRFLIVPAGVTYESAAKLRAQIVLNSNRTDYVDRALYSMSPGQRAGCVRFRKQGILFPFGSCTKEFDTPNPTFFQERGVWPMADNADPLQGWLRSDYMSFAPAAKADVYGSLFRFLGDLFGRFCTRVQDMDIRFHLLNVDACDLPGYLPRGVQVFDRIELANICDRAYIGPEKALFTFTPLLQPKFKNPKATLLMLFLNAVPETQHVLGPGYKEADLLRRMGRLHKIIGMSSIPNLTSIDDPEVIRLVHSSEMVADFDYLFHIFSAVVQMDACAKRYGVKERKQQSIIEKWPYRVTDTSSKEEFEILSGSWNIGWERYVEFERVEWANILSSG